MAEYPSSISQRLRSRLRSPRSLQSVREVQLLAELREERSKRRTAVERSLVLEQELRTLRKEERPPHRDRRIPLDDASTYLSVLLANLPFGVLVQDEDGQVVLANQSLCDLLQLPLAPEALKGVDWRGADRNARCLFSEPEKYAHDLDVLRRERRERVGDSLKLHSGRVVARDYVPLEVDGVPRGELFLFRDTTAERGREEAVIAARDAAEEANRTKATFLASMSHEMRTPLSAMIGIAELLEELELPPRATRYVGRIASNAEALRVLIEDILDFTQLESGHLRLRTDSFSPADVVRTVHDRLEGIAVERKLALSWEVKPGLPSLVAGDEARIAQLLSNLLSNALKFTKRGSVHLVAEPAADVSPLAVRYRVRDTGPGIAEDERDKIFHRFYRGAECEAGTGLGLSICQHLVGLMGGKIELSSNLGEGSEFEVLITHALAENHAAHDLGTISENATSLAHSSARLLLAEDDEDNRGLIKRILERSGYEVDVAQDGEVAIEKLLARSYDALVTDLSMPHLDGYGLLQWLREEEKRKKCRRLPALVVTAHALPQFEVRALAEGADAFMTKPIRTAELCKAVKCVLECPSTILIVDDSVDSRLILKRQLESTFPSALVSMVASGEEALTICKQFSFSLVLLDVLMSGMNGKEVVVRLRNLPGYERSAIVACTAYSSDDEVRSCLKAGFDNVISKPIRKPDLLNCFRRFPASEVKKGDSSKRFGVGATVKLQANVEVIVAADIEDLIPTFLRNRRLDVLRLRKEIAVGNWDFVKRVGHGMKGTGGAYGFDEISVVGERIEGAAMAENSAESLIALDHLATYLDHLRVLGEKGNLLIEA